MLGATSTEAKQATWQAALAEESDVGVGGEASGGGELLVRGKGKAAGGEITVADYERG